MKILIFTSASPFHELTGALAGGAEYALRSIAQSLATLGHEVHYVTSIKNGKRIEVHTMNNIRVHIYPSRFRLNRLRNLAEQTIFKSLHFLILLNDKLGLPWSFLRRRLCRLAEKFRCPKEIHSSVHYLLDLQEKVKFDVIHCYSSHPDIGMAEVIKSVSQVPYSVRMGGRFYYNYYKMLRGGKAERYFNQLKKSFDNADYFSFNSESLYDESRSYFSEIGIKFPEDRSNILDIGIDVDTILNSLSEIKPNKRNGSQDFKIVCVGKFKEGSKRQDLLLAVLKKIKDEKRAVLNRNLQIDFIGGGDLMVEHKQLAIKYGVIDQCVFHGPVPKQRVLEFLVNSDLFVFPTEFEGSSKALAEALLAEIPVLASNIPANVELLKQSDGGILFENDVEGLLSALQYAILNYDKMNEKTKLGKRYVLENLNSAIQVKKYEELFNQLSQSNVQ